MKNDDEKVQVELFLELANPNENGVRRWIYKTEFIGKYNKLMFRNGWSWGRKNRQLAKKFNLEKYPATGPIIKVRTNGFNKDKSFNQSIRNDIKKYYKSKKCVILGVHGTSENTKIEVDHKDGRKDDWRVSEPKTQKLEDFQPLCKAANDAKRQICINCKETDRRWDAKNILGNPYSFYKSDENNTEDLGCVGCYQYDSVEYRKESVKRITEEASRETTDFIMKKLYGDEK